MMTIRRFKKTDDEYRAVLDISNTLWPDEKQGLAEFKYEDASRDPKYTHARFVGEVDGKIVASGIYSHCSWSFVPGGRTPRWPTTPAPRGSTPPTPPPGCAARHSSRSWAGDRRRSPC